MNKTDWPLAYRRAHIAGGLRADNRPGERSITYFPSLDKTPFSQELPNFHALHQTVLNSELQLIGVEYVKNDLQMRGHMPTDWRPYYRDRGGDVPHKAETIWSELAIAGHDLDDHAFIDLCRRIEFQIQASTTRLFDVSQAYHTELLALLEDREFRAGSRVDSMNTFHTSLATHSVIVELATLRDFLAEFVGIHILRSSRADGEPIQQMSSLLKKVVPEWLGKHKIADEIHSIGSENGWLKTLTDYRNLIVHYTPLATAERWAWVERQTIRIATGQILPSIYFALPADPADVKRARRSGEHFRSWKEWVRNSFKDAGGASGPDALLYCYFALGQMCEFAWRVADSSPIRPKRPQPIHLTSWVRIGNNSDDRA